MTETRETLLNAFCSAVDAAKPSRALLGALPDVPKGRTVVVGGGKAAAGMARALELAWPGELSGVVVTRYGHALEHPERIEVLEASHPVPDEASQRAGTRILETVRDLSKDDLVIALLSGGGSALMVAPDGVTLAEKIRLSEQLLRSGADITEMNTVRKHLSRLKGGHLAIEAMPARIVSLIVSDVVGDDLSVIASGPTVPDPSTFLDAIRILERYEIKAPAALEHFRRGIRGEIPETPKPDHPAFARTENHLIVTNATALEAARHALEHAGFQARVLSDRITGEARDAAREHAREALKLAPGEAFLSGGETTVTVRGGGRGGRNLEFLLALALELRGANGIHAIACDTDGIDGTSQAAGAIITPDTLGRAARLGLDAHAMLHSNDAYTFFERLGDLVQTGPTGTNVNDFRCVLRIHP
jgi:hydroxypyruvate reductase